MNTYAFLTENDFVSNYPSPSFTAAKTINGTTVEVYKYADSKEATVWIKTNTSANIYGAPKTSIERAFLKANILLNNLNTYQTITNKN